MKINLQSKLREQQGERNLMQTISKQTKSMLVDLSTMISDTNNPIIKAFKHKGSVFGFASYYTDILVDQAGII